LPSDAFLQRRYPDKTPAQIADVRPEYWPNVPVVFQTYHIMIACWGGIALVAFLGLFLWWRGKLWQPEHSRFIRFFLWLCILSIFLPQIASQSGWFTAEMGRQPWVVYEILKTSEALSEVVRANQVLTSLILFGLIYFLLFLIFLYSLNSKIQHGPSEDLTGAELPEKWRPLSMKGGRMEDVGKSPPQ